MHVVGLAEYRHQCNRGLVTSDGGYKGRGWAHARVPHSSIKVQGFKVVLVAGNLAIYFLVLPDCISQVLPAAQSNQR